MWHNLGKTWQAALCVKYTNNNKSLVLQQDVKWDTRTGGATYNLLREREDILQFWTDFQLNRASIPTSTGIQLILICQIREQQVNTFKTEMIFCL